MVEIAKFFRSMKQTVNTVKESINEEIHLEDIKKEAESYKQQLLEAQSKVNTTVNLDHLNDEINSLVNETQEEPTKPTATKVAYEEPTFTKDQIEEKKDV